MYIPEYLKSLPSGDYERKSTDDKDHQVASLSQQRTSNQKLHKDNDIPPASKVYTEAISAKKPGRAQFNQMLDDVKEGIIQVIAAWDLSRLSRNPIDSGRLSWLLQTGRLKAIVTPFRIYLPEDNVIIMSVEFSQSNQFLRDLSKNVKRGLSDKLEKGWRPGLAPEGYLNDNTHGKGNSKIKSDPKRFKMVRRMWDLLLTGNYSVPQILTTANEEWGYRMRPHKTMGSRPMSRSGLYRIFTNTFYYGEYQYGGNWYDDGNHEKMITPDEYDRAQAILGRKGKQRPKTREFSFTGMIYCGECEATITAEEKINKYGTRYIYYHCTKRKDPHCSQRSVELQELKKQVNEILSNVNIPESFKDWAIKHLNDLHDKETQEQGLINSSIDSAYADCLGRINNLIKLKISPMNTDGSVLSDEDYQQQMIGLKKEKKQLEGQMKVLGERVDQWEELSMKTFQFARYAKYHFENGTLMDKRIILQTIGSNFILENRKLRLNIPKPYIVIENSKPEVNKILSMLELDENAVLTPRLAHAFDQSPILRRGWDSNPRLCCHNDGFQDHCTSPLCDLSKNINSD